MTETDCNRLIDEYWSIDETARQLDVAPRTVARYMAEPDGLEYIEIGGKRRSTPRWVQDWLARRKRRPNPRRSA